MIKRGLFAAIAFVSCAAPASAQRAHDEADSRATTGFGLQDGDLGLRRLDQGEVLQNFRAMQAIARKHEQACATYGCIVLVNLTGRPITRLYLRKSGAEADAWGRDWLQTWGSGALRPKHGIVLLGNSAARYCNASIRVTLTVKDKGEDVESPVNLCTQAGEVRKLSVSESPE